MALSSESATSPETSKAILPSLTASWTQPLSSATVAHLSQSEWQRRQIVSFSDTLTMRERRNAGLWEGGISFALALLATESGR